jgi:hypothetical protein
LPGRVFRWEGAAAIEEHRVEGYMLTTLGQRTYAGAWVSPRGPEFSAVIVITKSHSPITELTGTLDRLSVESHVLYFIHATQRGFDPDHVDAFLVNARPVICGSANAIQTKRLEIART